MRREKLGKGTPSDYDSNAVDNVGAKRKGKIDGGAGVYDEEMEYGAGLQVILCRDAHVSASFTAPAARLRRAPPPDRIGIARAEIAPKIREPG